MARPQKAEIVAGMGTNNSLNFKYSDNSIGFDAAFILRENQEGLGIIDINQHDVRF